MGSLTVRATALNTSLGVITIDEMGNILSCNAFVTKIFGYPNDTLCKMNVSGLMPRPYSRFHAQYLKRYRATGRGIVVGDNRGRVVSAMHRDGHIFPIRLEVHAIQDDGTDKKQFAGKITLADSRQHAMARPCVPPPHER